MRNLQNNVVNNIGARRSTPSIPTTAGARHFGFTLVELLIVLTIIALLAALLFPVFARTREYARRSACQSNMKQISLALTQYIQDYDGVTPPRFTGTAPVEKNPNNWRVLISPYVKSASTFQCPSNPDNRVSATNSVAAQANTPTINVSYACNYNSGTGLGTFGNETGTDQVFDVMIEYPSETISVAETTSTRPDIDMDNIELFGKLYAGHMGFTNYLFADGHVKALKPLQTYYAGDGIRNMWHRDHSEFLREEVTP